MSLDVIPTLHLAADRRAGNRCSAIGSENDVEDAADEIDAILAAPDQVRGRVGRTRRRVVPEPEGNPVGTIRQRLARGVREPALVVHKRRDGLGYRCGDVRGYEQAEEEAAFHG